jgi:RHS repeat-associated protein
LSYSQDPVTNALRVIEENHYYPFGLKHNNYNSDTKMYVKENEILKVKPVPALFKTSYGYKFGGKELQEELGLSTYDFGARNYDPAIGRWMNIDPLAETSRRFSPYVYALNNPVFFIDPDGMESIRYSQGLASQGTTNEEWLSNNRRDIDKMLGGDGNDIQSMTHSTEEQRAEKEKEKPKNKPKKKSTATAGKLERVVNQLPSLGSTKNGTNVTLKNGKSYQVFNNKWVELSGVLIDPATFSTMNPPMNYPGQKIVLVDEALLREGELDALGRGVDWKGLVGSWGVESLANLKFAKLSPATIVVGFYYNLFKGFYDQQEENKQHDEDTEPKKP